MDKINRRRQIKFLLAEPEHDQIRLAAALCRTTMAELCRTIIGREAAGIVSGITLPSNGTTSRNTKRSRE